MVDISHINFIHTTRRTPSHSIAINIIIIPQNGEERWWDKLLLSHHFVLARRTICIIVNQPTRHTLYFSSWYIQIGSRSRQYNCDYWFILLLAFVCLNAVSLLVCSTSIPRDSDKREELCVLVRCVPDRRLQEMEGAISTNWSSLTKSVHERGKSCLMSL